MRSSSASLTPSCFKPCNEQGIAVGVHRIADLSQIGREDEVLGADILDRDRHVVKGDLVPGAQPRQVRVAAHELVDVVELDVCTQARGLLHLLGRKIGNLGHRMRDDNVAHAELCAAANHREHFIRGDMAGLQHQVLARDDFQHSLGLGRDLAVDSHLEPGAFLAEVPHVVVGVDGGQPYHLAVAA